MQSRSVVPGPANVPIKRGGLRLAILHAQARAHKALAQPHIYGCTERLCARGPARIAAPLRHAKTQEECLIYPAHPRLAPPPIQNYTKVDKTGTRRQLTRCQLRNSESRS
eukprot:scaffold3261_cov67-Phaeocystis_antarctica.AAC.3